MADQQPIWWKDSVVPILAIIRPEAKTETVAIVMVVVGYYFGSSKSSQAKDDTISTQLAVKDNTIKEQLDKQ
jgi:hypothetical protein